MRLVENMSDKDYFLSDELSQSDIKTLLEDPFAYFKGIKKTRTAYMDEGTALHCIICEPHNIENKIFVCDLDRVSQKAREEAGERILIKRKDFDNLLECANYVKEALERHAGINIKALKGEVACFGEVRGVKAKGKADLITQDGKGIIDIKKTANASQSAFIKTACNLHYGIQEVWYRELFKASVFYWLAIETEPLIDREGKKHYRFGLYQASDSLREQSNYLIDLALKIREKEADFNTPFYPSEFIDNDLQFGNQVLKTLEPPLWYLKRS